MNTIAGKWSHKTLASQVLTLVLLLQFDMPCAGFIKAQDATVYVFCETFHWPSHTMVSNSKSMLRMWSQLQAYALGMLSLCLMSQKKTDQHLTIKNLNLSCSHLSLGEWGCMHRLQKADGSEIFYEIFMVKQELIIKMIILMF